jgi:hypothetical protein
LPFHRTAADRSFQPTPPFGKPHPSCPSPGHTTNQRPSDLTRPPHTYYLPHLSHSRGLHNAVIPKTSLTRMTYCRNAMGCRFIFFPEFCLVSMVIEDFRPEHPGGSIPRGPTRPVGLREVAQRGCEIWIGRGQASRARPFTWPRIKPNAGQAIPLWHWKRA